MNFNSTKLSPTPIMVGDLLLHSPTRGTFQHHCCERLCHVEIEHGGTGARGGGDFGANEVHRGGDLALTRRKGGGGGWR